MLHYRLKYVETTRALRLGLHPQLESLTGDLHIAPSAEDLLSALASLAKRRGSSRGFAKALNRTLLTKPGLLPRLLTKRAKALHGAVAVCAMCKLPTTTRSSCKCRPRGRALIVSTCFNLKWSNGVLIEIL